MSISENFKLTKDIKKNKETIKQRLPIGISFDMIGRELLIGDTEAYLIFIDGFAKDNIMLFILEDLQPLKLQDISKESDVVIAYIKDLADEMNRS